MNQENSEIMVSVYCLAFNHEKYIRKTLEGFVTQKTNFKFEIIVHDDASTDNTPSIIKEYEERFPDIIKPIYQKENQHSQNIPFRDKYIYPAMTGKYIASCEGDDFWNDEYKLQKQFDALESHPECSISTHKVLCCNEDETPNERVIPEPQYQLRNSNYELTHDEFAEIIWIKGDYPFHTSSYFYRREIIELEVNLVRDVGIMMKAFSLGSVYYFDEPMSTRRLFSIGGFNYRLRKEGNEALVRLLKSNVENSVKFDDFTERKYHKFVQYRLNNYIIGLASFDPVEAKKLINEDKLSFVKLPGNLSLSQKIKYIGKYALLKISPQLLERIYRNRAN